MRSIAVAAVTAIACVLALAPAVAVSSTKPSLRVAASSELSLIGTGFKPRTLVTLRVMSASFNRRATVRTGRAGGFTYRFPTIDRCEPLSVVAVAANGVTARVPVTWFTRSCISPPPVQPGVPPPQPATAGA